ncbi:hypothetical protein UCDDA912_g08973 [Diaporthe ampelina]|uniref:Uncharacterized protein n=1 Tax=Diaporthe ampelina TaxID=1214573 RepID=A0A0G2HSH3_9PEZI|nr:hypothetical protein UCDDA912_g08973 [Diaporthe ampelina]
MHIPKNSSHYHHGHTGGTDSSPDARYELINNPITYEIALMVFVIAFAMLMLHIAGWVQSWTDADGCCGDYREKEGEEEEGEARPLNLALTADGRLLDNESGGQHRQYGTFYIDNGSWYDADGTEMSYDEWMVAVYDPLD